MMCAVNKELQGETYSFHGMVGGAVTVTGQHERCCEMCCETLS